MMLCISCAVIGAVLALAADLAIKQFPDETEWRRSGNGWKRKRHGHWEHTTNRDAMSRS